MEALITGNMFISTYRKVNVETKQKFSVRTMTRIVRDLKQPVEVIKVLQVL
jgi:hypothetical protein